MENNTRFTILAFPQYFDGRKISGKKVLTINIVLLPRNQNPLTGAIADDAVIPNAPAFATANLSFTAKIIDSLENFPVTTLPFEPFNLTTTASGDRTALFTALASPFNITNLGASNTDANVGGNNKSNVLTVENSVQKYLPLTYRKSFNFTTPVTNAKIDDSYACAMRNPTKNPAFPKQTDKVNWGQVFAFIMRQPLLAEKAGMIYHATLEVDETLLTKGGWLYVDLADGSDYKTQHAAGATFIKNYAVRIPALPVGGERTLFAPVHFPVAATEPAGTYDNVFIEASDYDDGFAKIVHSFQPVSQNFLQEESDGFHPTKETGIRLGWDDEQILTWYVRALAEDSSVGAKQRLDAQLGVIGYKIDVRQKGAVDWDTLNFVTGNAPLSVAGQRLGNFAGELNYQVYPSQINGDTTANYWLPMYFANWAGKSMVLQDDDAADIYQNNDPNASPNPSLNITGPAQNNLNTVYSPAPINTQLKYGDIYEFRIRLGDLSGGGPSVDKSPVYDAPSPIATTHFKRYVAPNTVRMEGLIPNNDSAIFTDASIKISRPLLGYPSVVFTGKYADPVTLLKAASRVEKVKNVRDVFGIADPDVESVEITVEIKALQMDNLLSVSGKESYIKYYSTIRNFPTASATFDDELEVPLQYADAYVLNFGDESDLGDDFGFTINDINNMAALPLPKGRTIRLTLRAVCKEFDGYYGLENANHDFDTRYGRTIQFFVNQPSENEEKLLLNESAASQIKGIYLQPDPPPVFDGNYINALIGKAAPAMPDIVQRLSQQLDIQNSGLTLVGNAGQRVQFGCSNRIRHTLSPDNSSITFASKEDLINHWLVCIKLEINRDWTWDALEDISFLIERKKRFQLDDISETVTEQVGSVEIKKTASINSLQNADRSNTTVLFIDAVEPKNALTQPPPNNTEPRFPDLIELEYTVTPQFKAGYASQKDQPLQLSLQLPITTIPAQLPQIASAGIALSPYHRNTKYSTTGPRQRYLWVEFAEPVKDDKDIYFARVLAYAPDQLISSNNPELFVAPDEPPLPIDPEYIRLITPNQSIDNAGMNAMQPMQKANDSDTHFLLPLPPGLSTESPEMFGFFTYEIRVGHYKYKGTGQNVWTTAQGRFGRALRATGIQHPAPVLLCNVNRDEEKLYVTAPFAQAVYKGKNVTSNPPRTQLWALLYAQVKQADNKDYRNVLLNDKKMDWRTQVLFEDNQNVYANLDDKQIESLKLAAIQNWNPKLTGANNKFYLTPVDETTINKDAGKYGTTLWQNDEVNELLYMYGLPADSALSVLCVEILPAITNIYEHINEFDREETRTKVSGNVAAFHPNADADLNEAATGFSGKALTAMMYLQQPKPLSDQLGEYRILRTSPLVEVPFVCCTDC